jgi:rubredoxin
MEYVCVVCGHVHDEETEGKWDTLPEDFVCPDYGVGKEDYVTLRPMKQKFRDAYMKTAETFAELSSARRLHVGAIVVKDDRDQFPLDIMECHRVGIMIVKLKK